ncbi:MAG: tetratricopeptide repeat protein, partial [Anaerolineae bacterium]|nr:tetratricopeptide repeat protein [Anaerolineae bacterium]
KRQQKVYHAAAAQWLIDSSAERADEYTGLIAEHYEKAGELVQAAGYLFTLADQAFRVSALHEARVTLRHILAILPADTAAHTQRLRLRTLLLLSEIEDAGGYYNEVATLLESGLTIARDLGAADLLAQTLATLGRLRGLRFGEIAAGEAYLLEAEPLARASGDLSILLFTLRQIGNLYGSMAGREQQSVVALEESLQLARNLGDDFAVAGTLNSLGNTYATLQEYDRAIAIFEEAVAIGRRSGDLRIVAFAIGNMGNCFMEQKDYDAALRVYLESLKLSEKLGLSTTVAAANVAQVLVLMGGPARQVEQYLQSALLQSLTHRELPLVVGCIEIYGLLYAREGSYDTALEFLGLALASDQIPPVEKAVYIDPALARLGQHFSPAEIEAGLARGAALDPWAVGRRLLPDSGTHPAVPADQPDT